METRVLTSLGLSHKAAKIYLAGLGLGTTTVQELARKSGLKRPTVYLHIDELVKHGLIEEVMVNKKRYQRVAEPRILQERLQKNLSVLERELPKLNSLRADTMGKPQVQIFEGEEGVRQVYEELKNTRSVRFWSNIGHSEAMFHNEYMEICEAVREKGIGAREIIADNKEAKRYSRLVAKVSGPSYSARVATVEGIENDSVIYDNVVAIFRLQGLNMFVVRIEDATIADTMRAMFDMAWKTARPFR